MLLVKFKKIINEAEEKLLRREGRIGVCGALGIASCGRPSVRDKYDEVSCPKDKHGHDDVGVDNEYAYFNGELTLENLPRRIDSLRLFEQIAISDKLYKEF